MTIGATAGRYRIHGRIAVGGMGEVYLASMSTFDGVEKSIALKVVRADLVADLELAHLFVEEAKVAMSLSHANIVQAFDVGRLDERWFLAMEHVDGVNLGSVLRACARKLGQPLPQRYALYLAVEALKGLDYAHRRVGSDGKPLGIVHRDISPANILVSFEGEVKIADFGIAKSALRTGGATGKSVIQSVKGKVPYMAPEQLRGASVDRRADLYSMGAVLYEMLTGKRMFPGPDDMNLVPDVLAGRYRRPRELSKDVPEALEQIVTRAVALEPDARYPNAAAMRQELESFAMMSGYLLSSTDVADFVRDVTRATVPDVSTPRTSSSIAAEKIVDAAGTARAGESTAGEAADPFDAILGMELEKVDSEEPFSVFTSTGVGGRRELTAPLITPTRDVPQTRPRVVTSSDDPQPTSTASVGIPGARSGRAGLFAAAAVVVLLGVVFVGYRMWGSDSSAVGGTGETTSRPRAPVSPPVIRRPTTPFLQATDPPPNTPPAIAVTVPTSHDVAPVRVQKTRPIVRGGSGVNHQQTLVAPTAPASTTTTTTTTTPTPPPGAEPARVSINTDPWTYVTIDGELVRATPLLRHSLPAGRHRVLLRNPSEHIERNLVLDLAPGEDRRVSLDLRQTP